MRWLVTGAGGYIGAHLLQALLSQGHSVLPVVGKSESSKKRMNFLGLQGVNVDVTDDRAVRDLFSDYRPDIVVHLASLKSPEESNKNADLYMKNNLGAIKSVFYASLHSGTKVFINASSSAVYGDLDSLKIREIDNGNPVSIYGKSKSEGERLIESRLENEISACSLRLFNVIGSKHKQLRETAHFHLIPATISKLINGERPLIFGKNLDTPDGTAIRDYIHVQDTVQSIYKFANLLIDSNFYNNKHLKVNIGSGEGTSVLEIVSALQELAGTSLEPIYLDRRQGDPVNSVSDASLARTLIDFKSNFSLTEMLASCF